MDGKDLIQGTGTTAGTGAYRVLARKYRPESFADLVGQEPMVRTLTNAFRTGRIAQAYMLTGVRGVGKTTTARILARALNYELPGRIEQPTIDMLELGIHCAAIMEGRHVDVIEMDAASHNGIDDIREISEASRYMPAVARYKVYILDEVHMLSRPAFNGLLKTLEEPPAHVKFIFATTEIRKVPVTVLSRCQRFDLRRIEVDVLVQLLAGIASQEGITIDEEGLAGIARAAEGSARDALSILDQAIAHGSGAITGADVRQMLGLADHGHVIDLFEQVMRGETAAGLANLDSQYRNGADPAVVLEEMAAFTHLVTRLKVAPAEAGDASFSEQEIGRGREFAGKLSLRLLSRAWQMLLKGIEEVRAAPRPVAAADMVLVRIAHAVDLPGPEEAAALLASAPPQTSTSAPAERPSPRPAALSRPTSEMRTVASQPAPRPAPPVADPVDAEPETLRLPDFAAVVALASEKRDLPLKIALERNARLIRFQPGRIELALTGDAPTSLAGDLSARLLQWTGQRWVISIGAQSEAPTIHEQRQNARAQMVSDARADPVVAAVLSRFPGAEVVDVRVNADTPAAELPIEGIAAEPESDEDD